MNYRYFGIDSYQKRPSSLTQSCFHRLGPLGFLSLGNDTVFGNQVCSNADTSGLPQSNHTYVVLRGCGTWSLPCTSFRRTLVILVEIQRRQPPSPASSPPTLIFCLQVTLFGQSAGAMAVQNLMLSPHTKDKELFRFPEWWSGWNKSWWSQARELASCIVPMMKRFLISSSASESSGASSPSTGRQFFSPDRSSQPSLTRTSTPPSIAGRTAMWTV